MLTLSASDFVGSKRELSPNRPHHACSCGTGCGVSDLCRGFSFLYWTIDEGTFEHYDPFRSLQDSPVRVFLVGVWGVVWEDKGRKRRG